VESRLLGCGRVAQRQLLYLGEINASQREAWRKTIEVHNAGQRLQVALFPVGSMPCDDVNALGVCLNQLRLERPRQWGACWLALHLWRQLELDSFWRPRLRPSRARRPAPVRIQPRQARRLPPSRRDARGLPAELRGTQRRLRRLHRAQRLPGLHPTPLWPGPPHLGDGLRHPHRGQPGQDARAGCQLPGGHAQGALESTHAALAGSALGAGARRPAA